MDEKFSAKKEHCPLWLDSRVHVPSAMGMPSSKAWSSPLRTLQFRGEGRRAQEHMDKYNAM